MEPEVTDLLFGVSGFLHGHAAHEVAEVRATILSMDFGDIQGFLHTRAQRTRARRRK